MVGSVYSSISKILSRRLVEISRSSSDSLLRLSTGERLARPADDLASFSMLVGLDSQIRGLRQASLNINKAQGITLAADTALLSLSEVVADLRELALEASDSSLSEGERNLLSQQASELLSEFSSITSSTSFNGRDLLTGLFADYYVQTGSNAGEGFSFSIGDARATSLGRIAIYSGAQGSLTNAIGSGANYVLSLNGISIGASSSDGVSSSDAEISGIAIANAINLKSSQTGVYAEALATERTLTIDSFGGAYTGSFSTGDFLINGVDITGAISDVGELVEAINDQASSSGVTAELNESGNIVLTAEDGRNIQLTISNSSGNAVYDIFDVAQNDALFGVGAATLSNGADETLTGAIQIYSSSSITVSGGSQVSLTIGISDGVKALVDGTSTANINFNSRSDAEMAIKILDATLEDIDRLRSEVGAVHSRLDYSYAFALNSFTGLEATREAIGGVDVILETANLAVQQLLQDATLAALMQANTSYSAVTRLLSEGFPK